MVVQILYSFLYRKKSVCLSSPLLGYLYILFGMHRNLPLQEHSTRPDSSFRQSKLKQASPGLFQLLYPFILSSNLKFRLLLHLPNRQLWTVLLQHTLVMIFPELFRSILACHSFEDFGTAWMFVCEFYFHKHTLAKGPPGEQEGWLKSYEPVTLYTFSSIIMYIPFSASLCSATSDLVNCFDIFAIVVFVFGRSEVFAKV